MYSMRQAVHSDKETILSIRPTSFEGMDYLPSYIDHFFNSKDRTCMICEKDGVVVGFIVMFFIDDGNSCVLQTARVKKENEGQGVYSFMTSYCRQEALEKGATQSIVGNNSLMALYKTQFEKAITVVATLEINTRILGSAQSDMLAAIQPVQLQKMSRNDVGAFFDDAMLSQYLFPNGRIVVDWVPYRTIPGNTRLLEGAYTQFYSDVTVQNQSTVGLLSSWTCFDVRNPDQLVLIDFFGQDTRSLEKHLKFYLNQMGENLKSKTISIHVNCQDSGMLKESFRILDELEVPPYKWSEDLTADNTFFITFFERVL